MNVSSLRITHVRARTLLLCIPLGDSSSDDEGPPSLLSRKDWVDSSSDDELPPSDRARVVAKVIVDSDPSTADFQRLFRQMQLSSVNLDSASDLEEVD